MPEGYAGRQVVGMDLHRRRSGLVRMTEDGRKLGTARIMNNPAALLAEPARAGENPRVVMDGGVRVVLDGRRAGGGWGGGAPGAPAGG